MTKTDAIVYAHGCLSQARLLERLETFKAQNSNFRWRMAEPGEQKNFLRRHTVVVFPVIQVGKEVIQGLPELEDIEKAWSGE